jgi:ABC-2 type transport system ATP-binding protein
LDILKIEAVNKTFGDVQAVRDLSLKVGKGRIFGFIGPNGAGKTTTIRMVMQILLPDSGKIEIFGKPPEPGLTNRIGYLPEERGLYKKMKVEDQVAFLGEIKGLSHAASVAEAKKWLERVELAEWAGKKIEELSKGMQQKIQFVGAVLHQPELLILDEPFSGLDPVNTNLLKDILLGLKSSGATVIFSTHQMDQVEKLCDAICLIDHGRNLLEGSLPEVKARFGKGRVHLRYEGRADFLQNRSLVAEFNDYGKFVEIRPAAKVAPQDILQAAAREVTVTHFEIAEPSMNEIFIQVVQSKGGQA